MKHFSTAKLDKIISDRCLQLEQERQDFITKIQQWLEQFASKILKFFSKNLGKIKLKS